MELKHVVMVGTRRETGRSSIPYLDSHGMPPGVHGLPRLPEAPCPLQDQGHLTVNTAAQKGERRHRPEKVRAKLQGRTGEGPPCRGRAGALWEQSKY